MTFQDLVLSRKLKIGPVNDRSSDPLIGIGPRFSKFDWSWSGSRFLTLFGLGPVGSWSVRSRPVGFGPVWLWSGLW